MSEIIFIIIFLQDAGSYLDDSGRGQSECSKRATSADGFDCGTRRVGDGMTAGTAQARHVLCTRTHLAAHGTQRAPPQIALDPPSIWKQRGAK
jgi:hypothetical protein